jgi:hypothetical protein
MDLDPTGDKAGHTWLFQQPQQMQSTSCHQSLTPRVIEKSTWSGTERNSWSRPPRRSSGRLTRKLLGQPIWPRMPKKERGTTTCRTTWVRQMMSLGMVLPRGDTTQSSIHDAQQTEIDSRTGHDQSERKSVGLSTRGRRSTALWHRTPWPQGCSSINSLPTYQRTTKKLMHT